MAFPTIAATNNGNSAGNATSHTVNLPASISSGDLLIVVFSVDATPATITWPSGWTQLFSVASGVTMTLQCYFRRADGTEGASITVTTSASQGSSHVSYRITGHHATSDPEVATPVTHSSSLNPDPPSLDPAGWATEDTLWIACYGNDATATQDAYPTNYTLSQVTDAWDSAPHGTVVAIAGRNNAASIEDPGTFTIGTSRPWVAGTIAVRPAAGAGGFTLACDAGSYSVTGQTTSLIVSRAVSVDQGSYSITGQAASLLKGFAVALDQGAYSVTGQAATLTVDRVLAAGQGSYAISGQVTELLVGHVIDFAAGSYAVTGQAVVFNKGFTLIADLGSYAVTGQAVGLIASRVLSFDPGSYALAGQSTSLLVGRVIALDQGSYSLSGQSASLLIARVLAFNLGAYTVTGLDVTLTYTPTGGFTIELDLGNYSVTGQDVSLIADRSLDLDQGNYAITGQAADLMRGFVLSADQGSYTVTGQAANLLIAHLLALSSGVYSLTGLAATLDYSGAAGGGVVETIYKGIRRGIDKDMVHP